MDGRCKARARIAGSTARRVLELESGALATPQRSRWNGAVSACYMSHQTDHSDQSDEREDSKMNQNKTYRGSCHCGNVKYDVELDLSGPVIACNCSMCGRTGALMAFVPEDKLQLLTGAASLSDYQFNTKNIHHLFCSNCGVRSFARGTGPGGDAMCMVNVRCLEGVDPSTLDVKPWDGKSR